MLGDPSWWGKKRNLDLAIHNLLMEIFTSCHYSRSPVCTIYIYTVFIDIFGQIAQNALNSGLRVIVICPDALNDLGPASAKWPFDHPNGGHFSHLQRSRIRHPKGSRTAEPRICFFVGYFICFTYSTMFITFHRKYVTATLKLSNRNCLFGDSRFI